MTSNYSGMLNEAEWPLFDENKCKESTLEIVVQVNGKIKAKLIIEAGCEKAKVIELARQNDSVLEALEGMEVLKEIYVENKLVNIVVKPK